MVSLSRALVLIATCINFSLSNCVPAAAGEDVLWPQQPIRIDRSKQTYERLPALQQIVDTRRWIVVPNRIKVLNSASFSFDGKSYRIAQVHPISTTRICGDRIVGRWTCGRLAAILLGNLVRDKRLLCDVVASGKETILDRCQSGRTDVASEIIAGGYGRPEGDSRLQTVEDLARKKQSGLWRDPACVADFDHC